MYDARKRAAWCATAGKQCWLLMPYCCIWLDNRSDACLSKPYYLMQAGQPSTSPALSVASGPLSTAPTGFSSDARRVISSLAGPWPDAADVSLPSRDQHKPLLTPHSSLRRWCLFAQAQHVLQDIGFAVDDVDLCCACTHKEHINLTANCLSDNAVSD